MGKTTEKIIFLIVSILIATVFTFASNKIFLINDKADTKWVQSRDDKIYEYIDKRDDEIKMTHRKDIEEIKKGQEKILDYILKQK